MHLPLPNVVATGAQPKRVKAKLIAPLALALAAVLTVFAFAIYQVERRIREQDLAERSLAVERLFATKLDKDGGLMRATVRAMMGNHAIETAFRRADRGVLEKEARGLFDALRADHHITHLYFTGRDRVNLYRLHSPEAFGDVIDRATMLQAHSRKQPVHGLELGPLGTLTLRMVMPWPYRDGFLGYVEIGEEVGHLIDEVHRALSVDLLVLVNKRFLSPQQWQHGQTLMKRAGDWSRFTTHVAIAAAGGAPPASFDDRALARLLALRTTEMSEGGRSVHMAVVPLADAGGRHVGELVVTRDITALGATFGRSMLLVTVASLAVAAAVLALFYFALDRVERDYQRQHDLEHQLLRMNTEHRRILQLEKLSSLGTMVGGIAHQLNNPLVGVVNMAQLAERSVDDAAKTRELLGEIRRAGDDCRLFVKRMLEFSKATGFDARPTAIAALIDDTVLMFRQAERRHLPVEVSLPDPSPMLTIDPILVRHALFNLLQNAAQATDGVRPIRITLKAIDDPGGSRRGWELAVTDQGRGMTPDVLDNVFVPFFTTRSDGTGLGLPVVQQVVLLHDGHVTARSEPGHGTRIALWFPADPTVT